MLWFASASDPREERVLALCLLVLSPHCWISPVTCTLASSPHPTASCLLLHQGGSQVLPRAVSGPSCYLRSLEERVCPKADPGAALLLSFFLIIIFIFSLTVVLRCLQVSVLALFQVGMEVVILVTHLGSCYLRTVQAKPYFLHK